MKKYPSQPSSGRRRVSKRSAGFALLELVIAISISAILAIYANQELATLSQEVVARGGGTYLRTVAQAVEKHIYINFNDFAAGNDIAGTANDLQPTIPELIAINRLRVGFPLVMPTRQVARVDIRKTGCPGVGCQVVSTVCTTTPITWGTAFVRFDLARAMLEEQSGQGGQARYGDGANIRGPALNVPNPLGNVEGIVCSSSYIDLGMFDLFVKINDTRDPQLYGPLTVAGATTLNGPTNVNNTLNVAGATTLQTTLAVTGSATVGPCINLAGGAQGRAAFGCSDPNSVPAGYTGGVRSIDVVASGNVLASDNPAGFTGANGNYALVTANNGAGAAEIRTSGRAAADRLTPIGSYAIDAVCAAADEGSIAKVLGGSGLVVCGSGKWRAMSIIATSGDACTKEGSMVGSVSGAQLLCVNGFYRPMDEIIRYGTPGSVCSSAGVMAIDTNNKNESLICRANLSGGPFKWMPLRDVTTHMVLVSGNIVHNNDVVNKPFCADTPSNPSTPMIHLLPKYTSTADGGTAVYAIETATSWTIRLKNGSGLELTGAVTADNPSGLGTAIAQVYCYFP